MKPLYKALCKFVPALALTAVLGSCDAEKDLVVVEPSTSNVPYDEMYMVGYGLTPYIDGDPFVSNTAYQMDHTDDPNVFTATIEMYHYTDNKQFKFVTAQDDWNKVKYIVPESGVVDGTSYAYVEIGADKVNQGAVCSESAGNLRDHFWGIPEGSDGTYRITVNVKKLKLTLEKISDETEEPEPEIKTIYGLGSAFGWDSGNPTGLTPDPDEEGIYTAEVNLIYSDENKQFKFCLEKGDWDKVNYLVPESVDHNGNVKIVTPGEYPMFKCSEMEGNLRDHFWGIPEGTDGKYKLTVNTQTLKLKVEKVN